MVRDMLRLGHPSPEIAEIGGPMVRTVLVGGPPDASWICFLDRLQPPTAGSDLDSLLLLARLVAEGWLDDERAAAALQKTTIEARHALDRLGRVTGGGALVVAQVAGTAGSSALRLSNLVRRTLAPRLAGWLAPTARLRLAREWARRRGRVTTTELSDLLGIAANSAGELLNALESQGQLAPGRPTRRGRGFFYVPIEQATS